MRQVVHAGTRGEVAGRIGSGRGVLSGEVDNEAEWIPLSSGVRCYCSVIVLYVECCLRVV